ncbi:hypothetical protein [Acinetobacter soli]|uniref:hypothetical protein n=1 Tax=Acinetobacter soli TaxID=487316 RepID=UPI00370A1F9A
MIELSLSLKKIEEEINFAKTNIRKLSNLISGTKKEIENYEVKFKKYAKQKDEVGFKKIEIVLKNLQVRLDNSQKELNILNDKYDEKTIKKLQEEKKLILSKIKKQGNKQILDQQLLSNAKVEKEYNVIRDNYVLAVKTVMDFIETSLPLKQVKTHEEFIRFLNGINETLPDPKPTDTKAGAICALLKDFIQSYNIAYQRRKIDLPAVEQLIIRFIMTFNRCKNYLKISMEKPVFTIEKNKYAMSEIIIDNISETDIDHILKHKDDSVIDNVLCKYLTDTIEQIYEEGLITSNEKLRLNTNIYKHEWQIYEQLFDFDFDEFVNSVQNSINSARRFKNVQGSIPLEFKRNLMSNFEYEIHSLNYSIIPKNHEFYSYIDDNDRLELVKILKILIEVNNSYEGVNDKIASTLLSKNNFSFDIKKRYFNYSKNIGQKYFYGKFITRLNKYNKYQNSFLDVFANYINLIFKESNKAVLFSDSLNTFYKSMYWHVLNEGCFGGIALFKYGRIHSISDRSLLLKDISEQELVKAQISPDITYAKILKDEYATTFLLNYFDLRFKNILPKYDYIEKYENEINNMAIDLREMRRLLVKNFKAVDTIIDLELPLEYEQYAMIGAQKGKIYALWQWETFGDGLGRICIGYDQQDMSVQATKQSRLDATYRCILRVNRDGLISPVESPWLNASLMDLVGVEVSLDANLYVIRKFHALFIDWYAKAAQKIKQRNSVQKIPNEIFNDEIIIDNEDYEQILVQNSLNEQLFDGYSLNNNHIEMFNRGIKSKKFFKILEQAFNVVVEQGKGSEIKVSRLQQGGKIYRLGHHGSEVEYHATFVRKVLKRLNISLNEWSCAIKEY